MLSILGSLLGSRRLPEYGGSVFVILVCRCVGDKGIVCGGDLLGIGEVVCACAEPGLETGKGWSFVMVARLLLCGFLSIVVLEVELFVCIIY